MAKKLLAVGALALCLTFAGAGAAGATSTGACGMHGSFLVSCGTDDGTSPELAETGSVLGEFEFIVGVTGVVLLAGSGLLVVAAHRSAHRGARR